MRWLARQVRGQQALVWIAMLLGAQPLLQMIPGLVLRLTGGGASLGLFYGAQWALQIIASGALAWVSCRGVLDLRRSGTLELLLSTPVGARDLVPACWRELRQRLTGPAAVLGVCEFAFAWR